MEELNDILLLKRMAKDDNTAFACLFNRYRNKIYSIGLQLTHSRPLAEEIVQDVFLNVWAKREALSEVVHFRAYLFTTARNIVIDALRKKASQERLAREAGQPITYESSFDVLLNKQYETVLQTAIGRLTPRQREVYHLVHERGLKREEVAAQLNISAETVKSVLAAAMLHIRAYCKSHLDLLSFLLISILLD